MPLDPASEKKVKDWLAAKGGMGSCPVCNGTNWQIGEAFGISIVPIPLPASISPKGVATIAGVVCSNCGYVRFFSARAIGLVP
jgi:hypothetical protein